MKQYKKLIYTLIAVIVLGYVGFVVLMQNKDDQRPDPAKIEAEVRAALPIGASRAAVESYLTKHTIEHSFDENTDAENAIVRELRGSTNLIRRDLTMHFQYNGDELKTLDIKTKLTGL